MRTSSRAPAGKGRRTGPRRAHRRRGEPIDGGRRALGVAMCRGLRERWDAEDAAGRVVALQLGVQAVEAALESARRLNEHDPTVATARAEVALARALALCEPEEGVRRSAWR